MRSEHELLVCCTRVSRGPRVQARIEELLQRPLDWQTVLTRAWWHRIRPLTYLHLRSQPAGMIPKEVLEELGGQSRQLAERNQNLWRALREVTDLFEASALRALVFKGPSLSVDAYGDLNLRECGDLDVLVHPEDLFRATQLLKSSGFSTPWDRAVPAKPQQVFAYDFQRHGIALDVHWDLAPGWLNYRVNFDRLWEGGHSWAANSRFVRKLRPEDSIVVLCIHGAKHWWERLRWICDIAELVNSGRVTDWDRLSAEATEAKGRRSVSLGLWLAGDLLSARLPEEIRRELARSSVVKRLAAQVGAWLAHVEQGAASRSLRERFLFRMRLCERMRDRVPQIAYYLLARPSVDSDGNPT